MQTVKQLKEMAREHWKKFQPSLFKKLTKKSKLEEALQEAAEWTYKQMKKEVERRVKNGEPRVMAESVARELFLEERILVPEETGLFNKKGTFPHSELLNDLNTIRKLLENDQ